MVPDTGLVERRPDGSRAAPTTAAPSTTAPSTRPRVSPAGRIGDALVASGSISPDQLRWALGVQRRTGSRLGRILLAAGLVSRLSLHRVLAEQWGVHFVDLTTVQLDPGLVQGFDPALLVKSQWVPIYRYPEGSFLVASAEEPTPALRSAVERALGAPVDVVATTEWDVDYALRLLCRPQLLDEACHGLWRRDAAR